MSIGAKSGILALVLATLGAGWYLRVRDTSDARKAPETVSPPASVQGDPAWRAFEARSRDLIIMATGTVERILADDRDGSPHQRFIIRTPKGLSLLIAHNLDLAPRLEGLREGEFVTVLGEYEWNEKGGVMHWTHDDPRGQHAAGYIEWRGKRYQ